MTTQSNIVIINDVVMFGVHPGKNVRDTLLAPIPKKDYITNESRLENGKRVLGFVPKNKSRTFTLEFQILAPSSNEYETIKSRFLNVLDEGFVSLRIPSAFPRLITILLSLNL